MDWADETGKWDSLIGQMGPAERTVRTRRWDRKKGQRNRQGGQMDSADETGKWDKLLGQAGGTERKDSIAWVGKIEKTENVS
jgi:hypothetical protein